MVTKQNIHYTYIHAHTDTHITNFKEQTLRNVTETISPPFDARTEEMKRKSQNI